VIFCEQRAGSLAILAASRRAKQDAAAVGEYMSFWKLWSMQMDWIIACVISSL
jgi:hypothetical protein